MLSAYNFKYVLRNAMKAQALADFIAEMTPPLKTFEPTIKEWKVWVDGACGARDSGIGIFLQSQTGIKLRYTAKPAFMTTNNLAE